MQKKNNGGLVAVSIVLGIILVALIVFTIALKAGSKKITLNPTKEKETVKVDRRYSGILLHPTSLPSPYGIGDMGQGAYDFVDFLPS
mgnify:CR=1 FL=1